MTDISRRKFGALTVGGMAVLLLARRIEARAPTTAGALVDKVITTPRGEGQHR